MIIENQENYFDLFGIASSFIIDEKMLEKKYFELQKQYHPDRLMGKDYEERITALHKAAIINDAYKILKDPLNRSEYLLFLNGKLINAEAGGKNPSQELLMEALDSREELAEAETLEKIKNLEGKTIEEKKQCIEELSNSFSEGNLEKAEDLTLRLKYLEKFLTEIKTKKQNYETS